MQRTLSQRTLSAFLAIIASLLLQAQPPNVPWTALGGGTDKKVQALLRLSNGDLLVAGQFTIAGGAAHSRVARWDGATYTALPGFPEQFEISSAAELNGIVYVGGKPTFQSPYKDLMKWDGSAWTGEDVFRGKNPLSGIQALFVHDGMLYASGDITGIVGTDYDVLRLNGASWELVGGPMNHYIRCIGYFDGHLVCAGEFTSRYLSTANEIQHVTYLDGNTWVQLGDGLDGTVYDLLVEGNTLYATGDMLTPTDAYFGLARITPDATTWEQLMPNIRDYVRTPVSGMMSGQSMVAHNGELYIGGEFLIGGATVGRGVAVFHGAPDEVEAYCDFGGPVQALALINDHELVIGGTSSRYQHIASTDLLANGITDPAARASFTVSPNPTTGLLLVEHATASTAHVLDMAGRVVLAIPLHKGTNTVDVRTLTDGCYLLRMADGDAVRMARFVKQ
ncbi:MAG: T9SS type A sorting domain-containing protein [Flavobacteriales bacterium]